MSSKGPRRRKTDGLRYIALAVLWRLFVVAVGILLLLGGYPLDGIVKFLSCFS